MQNTIDHYVNGKITKFPSNSYHEVFNPATGSVTSKVALAEAENVSTVIEVASEAYKSWSKQSPIKRARVFFKFNQLLNEHLEELAEIITYEHGKTTADAKGEVMRGIEVVEHYCGIANLLQGTYSNNVSTNIDAYTIRQSLGVCAGVSPFNFPVMVPVWMFMPAIACGNSYILKPSEKAPSAVMRMAELFTQAGLPDGVFNVVNGHKTAVDTLLNHRDVQAISAVGSTPVVEYIYKTAVTNNKRSTTFGGAKNHCIVMPDVDLDSVADAVSGAAFGAAGERCMALSVAVVVGDKFRHDDFITRVKEKANKIKVGPGDKPDSDMGPLITREHLNKVLGYIETGVTEGAKLELDGRDLKVTGFEKGFYLGPSIFTGVKPEMKIYQEEIFGPVLVVVHVDTYQQAVNLINKHEFGNGTAIFTNNMNIARQFSDEVQAGMVGINVPIPVPFVTHSFGGWKNSIFGDLDLHALDSVRFYTKPKSITVANARVEQNIDQSTSGLVMPVHN